MKKIFFVLPSMGSGGTQRKVAILLKYFQKRNYSLTLVLFEKIGVQLNEVPRDIKIIDLKKKNRWDFFKLIIKFGYLLQKQKPDKVISFIHYTNIVAVLAKMIFGFNGELIISEESFPGEYLLHIRLRAIKEWLMHVTYKRASKIICVSKALSNYIIYDFGVPKGKVFTIYNPLDLNKIKDLSLEKVSHPFLEKRKRGYHLIISVGRLTFQKRFDILLEAFAKTREKIKVLLLILGDGELLHNLKLLQKKLKLNDSVDFLGYISNPYAWMLKSDLFVMGSQWEGFGNVIIEAMACGLPVIFTNCPFGPNEIITDGVNGLLAPVGDVEAISKAIVQLFENEHIRKQLAEAGKKRAEDFRIDKIGAEYEKVVMGNK